MSSQEVPDRHDIGASMRFSPINPLVVKRIISCYRSEHNGISRIGFIAELAEAYPLGKFSYIVTAHDDKNRIESVRTQYFDDAPIHLYDRAEDWFIGGTVIEKINKELGYSKATAINGTSSTTLDPFKTD